MKKRLITAIYGVVLVGFSTWVLLDAFVIPHKLGEVSDSIASESITQSITEIQTDKTDDTSNTSSESALSYDDGNISIEITELYEYNTAIYVADIKLSSAEYLKTALAYDSYGTNITAKTSVIAEENGAIFAINGDYYGADSSGYVIKNGVLYRESVRKDKNFDDLVIYEDGSFEIINESNQSAQELVDRGVMQLLAFGPSLVENSEAAVTENSEVVQSMSSNPRTAIGIVSPLHYIVVVSDGRTSVSAGLSLFELANVMLDYNCTTAYNLDGGGSATMWFQGSIINNPTTNGRSIKERAVSDIVWIG